MPGTPPKLNEVSEADPAGLLEEVLRLLVTRPEMVQVVSATDGQRLNLEIKVHADDADALAGRSGQTMRALRKVIEASTAKTGCRLESLNIASSAVDTS